MTTAAFCFFVAYAISGNISVACVSAAGGIVLHAVIETLALAGRKE